MPLAGYERYFQCRQLYETLLEAIYYRLGLEDWIPSTVDTGTATLSNDGFEAIQWGDNSSVVDRRAQEIERLTRSTTKRWVVFVNGFETPGQTLLITITAPGMRIGLQKTR